MCWQVSADVSQIQRSCRWCPDFATVNDLFHLDLVRLWFLTGLPIRSTTVPTTMQRVMRAVAGGVLLSCCFANSALGAGITEPLLTLPHELVKDMNKGHCRMLVSRICAVMISLCQAVLCR